MRVSLLWLLLMPLAHAAQAADGASVHEVRELLARMVQALRNLSYSGTFVYLHDDRLESLAITRQSRDGQVRERLVSLNGPPRVVQRDPGMVTCVMPDAQAVSVDRRPPGSGVLSRGTLDLDRLAGEYLLHPLGDTRVAGRDTRVVGIIPKDHLRYGYRFYLDRQTGLPLKTDLMDRSARPIEQIMFTSLELGPQVSRLDNEPEAPAGFRRVMRAAPRAEASDQPQMWQFSDLPAGFRLQLHDHWQDQAAAGVEHFVLSDGLASVSVYVEQASDDGLQGGAHVGAINAWGRRIGPFQVTAVGEVPAEAVRLLAEALSHHPDGKKP